MNKGSGLARTPESDLTEFLFKMSIYNAPITPVQTNFGQVSMPSAPGRSSVPQPGSTGPDPALPPAPTGQDEEAQRANLYDTFESMYRQDSASLQAMTQQLNTLTPGTTEHAQLRARIGSTMADMAQTENILRTRDAKDKEGKNKFGLQELSMLILAMGAGVSVVESIDRIMNDEDISSINVRDELLKNTEAITDPVVRQKIIDASYGDQQALNDLENLSTYNNQFGSLSSDMMNSPYGETLEQMYQEFSKDNAGIDRDQFLVEFARANPTSEIAQDINQRLSRMGQIGRGANEFGEMARASIAQGMRDAGRFYTPVAQGGYGFTPGQFRSSEQNEVVDRAMGLLNSPEAEMLKRNVAERVASGGKLGQDALREITGDALTAVDPSLQAQPYLKGGGLANSVLNTELAQRKRLMEDEQSLFGILQGERNYMPGLSGIVNVNTVDPVKAMGLTGKDSSTNAINSYNTAPATGLNYDPTSGYMGSVTAQNANINQANMMKPSTGSMVTDLGNNVGDLNKALEGLGI